MFGSHGGHTGARPQPATPARIGLRRRSALVTPCSKSVSCPSRTIPKTLLALADDLDCEATCPALACEGPRWLIMVEGIANQEASPACRNATGDSWCWWGENILGQLRRPLNLSLPNRLVLSPHAYGHGDQPYFTAPDFPANMPGIWDALWGQIPERAGVPVIVGEWGGLWESTAVWQTWMQDYLVGKKISSFYWALNDNARSTGGLYHSSNYAKWHMLSSSPKTTIQDLQLGWLTPKPPMPPTPPTRPMPQPPVPPGAPPCLPQNESVHPPVCLFGECVHI